MSAAGDEDLGEAALAALLASSGVAVAQEEIAPVTRALARINAAAHTLLRPSVRRHCRSLFPPARRG
jgi:hypothetical protein